ncbi:MAG: exosortase T [Candidatus Competibacteraceae bacterium]|nr:exosortase T [Candidatus Competibacteraceae bacterium]MCB1804911.1 exosortase T [Candidatus Competibacteraceae bacterium]MCB1814081.1 exosortase T [Candidatus Competibacteraceae bacterium]
MTHVATHAPVNHLTDPHFTDRPVPDRPAYLPALLLLSAVFTLAWVPLQWLIQSWFDPLYGSSGLIVAALVLGLLLWSGSSPLTAAPQHRRLAWGLLLATALVRLAGQVLAINTLSAIALALDVYALGLLLGLAQRRRAIGPGWLALLFLCALPLERIAQRLLGYGLQQFSAEASCYVLGTVFTQVRCEGVRILLYGRDVLVDLPCSGSRGLLLMLILFLTLATLQRPGWQRAITGAVLCLAAALLANVLRICTLALGIAFAEHLPVSVMASPWHDLIGLAALGLGALPLLFWSSFGVSFGARTGPTPAATGKTSSVKTAMTRPRYRWPVLSAFLLLAVLINLIPARPVDVAQASEPPRLPLSLAGARAELLPLSPLEQNYFQRYGGGAARARYGELNLLLVSTQAPLRHLHAPDECLSGLGHQVEYLGPTYDGLPSALYRSTDPQGRQWRVAVSFFSDQGDSAISVAEAVWRWLQNPAARWTQVQRITAWELPESDAQRWDQAVARALELPLSQHL